MSQLSVVVKCGVMLCVLTGEHVTTECCGEVWSDDVCWQASMSQLSVVV